MKALALLAIIAAPTCVPPAPTPNPAVDAGDIYDQACYALREIGCPEATPACAFVMRASDPQIPMNPACVAACTTKSCVRACGPSIPCE